MILVLGGTADSRALTEALLDAGYPVVYSSVTAYNTGSLPVNHRLSLHIGAMDTEALCSFLKEEAVALCVDATHPYAKDVSVNAIAACSQNAVPYIRLERPRLMDNGRHLLGFDTYEAAADYLKDHPGNVLLTTGSRQLEAYQALPKERLVLRVLPTAGVLGKCEALGYNPKQIIAMQGPFSYDMNVLMIKTYKIDYLVTKDSGSEGGGAEKIQAAKDTGVTVLFIRRPTTDYPCVCHTVEETLAEVSTNVFQECKDNA